MRISDWSSDVCSSDLQDPGLVELRLPDRDRARLEVHVAQIESGEFAAAQTGTIGQKHHGVEDHRSQRCIWRRVGTGKIGRASCRERVCQYVSISVVAVSLKKKLMRKYRAHRFITKQSLD